MTLFCTGHCLYYKVFRFVKQFHFLQIASYNEKSESSKKDFEKVNFQSPFRYPPAARDRARFCRQYTLGISKPLYTQLSEMLQRISS